MAALAASERGLFSLLGVMEPGRMLPAEELRELTDVANQTAATMAATANEVMSMERAIGSAPQSRTHFGPNHPGVYRPVGPGCASVQRNGHRRSAVGVGGQHRVYVELTDDAAAVSRRTVHATDRLLDGRKRSTN